MSGGRFELVPSAAGVPALRDRENGEVMHPGLGPVGEAEQLYLIPSRLERRLCDGPAEPLVLLDVGLGAGSNAICALRCAEALPTSARRLELTSFDLDCEALAHALHSEQRAAFGFGDALSAHAAEQLITHQRYESARVTWTLRLGDALESLPREPHGRADVVFWDPFSPRLAPALWSEGAFTALRRVCREGATVHTFSAATATRGALLLAGFCVGLGPRGSAKQKHSTFAATRASDVAVPLDFRWIKGLPQNAPRSSADARSQPAAFSPEARARLRALPQLAEPALTQSVVEAAGAS